MGRLFFALWPDPVWSVRLLGAASVPMLHAAGRPVASADLHVTLCFLGVVAEPVLVKLRHSVAALRTTEFELEFNTLEYWPRSRVLALTGSHLSAAARELAGALCSIGCSLGLRADTRPLRPHVTLVRAVTSEAAPCAPVLTLPEPLRFAARRFYLAQSQELELASASAAQAQRYTRLESWPLLVGQ